MKLGALLRIGAAAASGIATISGLRRARARSEASGQGITLESSTGTTAGQRDMNTLVLLIRTLDQSCATALRERDKALRERDKALRELDYLRRERDEFACLNAEYERGYWPLKKILRYEAKAWRYHARAYQSIVREIYQAVTGATGEPGDWNGARPVIEALAEARGWQRAVEEACIVNWIDWDPADPEKSLAILIQWERQCAVDPKVNPDIAALHARIAELEAQIKDSR